MTKLIFDRNMMGQQVLRVVEENTRPCDICGADIFPRVTTREMGARCLTHAVGNV